jgi:protease II
MPTLNTRLFEGKEYPLVIYNGQAIINRAFRFYTVVDCIDLPYEEIDFDFPDYASSYLRVFNEKDGRFIIEISLSRDGSYLIVNASASDMTFDDLGNYYYEVGYVRGVYEQALRFGTLSVI